MDPTVGLLSVLALSPLAATATSTAATDAAATDDARLAKGPTLEHVLALVLAHNPDLAEVSLRTNAAEARSRGAGKLPEPELQYQTAGTPLSRPYAVDEADWHMIGLRQSIPPPGTLAAKERTAAAEVHMAEETARAKRAELVFEVRRAFADYYRTDREYRAHLEHADLSQSIIDLARSSYRTGRVPFSDVLRTTVELTRLHRSLLDLDQERVSTRARLNTLMGRAVDAPLGPAPDLDLPAHLPAIAELDAALAERRPEVRLADRAVDRSQAALEGAERRAKWPSFMVGADYMLMPKSDMPHAWGAMVAISLPWLTSRYQEEVVEAERTLAAEQRAKDSITNNARFQLRDAAARYDAARRSLEMLDRELVPQSREAFESASASFSAGTAPAFSVLDAMKAYLELRIEEIRTRAAIATAVAEVERAAGTLVAAPKEERARPAPGGNSSGGHHE